MKFLNLINLGLTPVLTVTPTTILNVDENKSIENIELFAKRMQFFEQNKEDVEYFTKKMQNINVNDKNQFANWLLKLSDKDRTKFRKLQINFKKHLNVNTISSRFKITDFTWYFAYTVHFTRYESQLISDIIDLIALGSSAISIATAIFPELGSKSISIITAVVGFLATLASDAIKNSISNSPYKTFKVYVWILAPYRILPGTTNGYY